MSPRRKRSQAEMKAYWKEAAKRRRERIKNDPILLEIEREKERKKYATKKKKGQVKLVKDITSVRDLKAQRKAWRERAKRSYERKKTQGKAVSFLASNTPPESDNDVQAPIPDNLGLLQSRRKSGRKKVKKNRAKVARDNVKLKKKNKELQKLSNKWRQKFFRLKHQISKSTDKNSPGKIVARIMKSGDKKEVRRRLLFGEICKRQLHESFNGLLLKKEKRKFGQIVCGNTKTFKKYRLLSGLRSISEKVFRKKRVLLTNNSVMRTKMLKISDKVKQDVQTFLEDDEHSKLCPGKKDCITKKKVKKQKRILSRSLKNLHTLFCKQVDYKISYTTFTKLRPFWIVSRKQNERDTCMCTIHANMELLTSSLFKANIIGHSQPSDLVNLVCCDSQNPSCLQRTCTNCKDLMVPYLLFDGSSEVCFRRWVNKMETYKNKNGVEKQTKHTVKETVTMTALEAIDLFEKEFPKFLFHEGIISHQFRALRFLKKRLNEEEILIHMDYSENYSLKYASEVQSFHFGGSRKQITLHTCEIYFKKDAYSQVSSKSMCTLSQSLDHGPHAVWAHLQPVFQMIKNTVPKIKAVHFLSDSPATQYRNRTIFYLLGSAITASFDHISVATWNYSAAGHGKGAPDGIGGCLKRTADTVVAQGHDIDSLPRLVEVLQENTRNIVLCVVHEDDIKAIKQMIPQSLPPFKGTMKTHQIVFLKDNPKELKMRTLSCFHCFDCKKHLLGTHDLSGVISEDIHSPTQIVDVDCEILNDEILHPGPSTQPQIEVAKMQSTTLNMSTTETPAPGSFALVQFSGFGNKSFRYVCSVEKLDQKNGSLWVNGLRSFEHSRKQFIVKENDECAVKLEDVVAILPLPRIIMTKRKVVYCFDEDINICEK